ncbi:hypothetical protein ACSMFR_02425 [Listeria aquatica]|uniref:hypothetical protein n=1 Tax=Listeria aquatica TaxID=1494960 RepID=UPI003F6E5121
MYSVIRECVDEDLNPITNCIVIDLEYLTFIEPSGQTILSNLIEWLHHNNCTVKIKFKTYSSGSPNTPNKRVMEFLGDISFFSNYLKEDITQGIGWGPRANTCPLELINYSDAVDWIRCTFLPWMGRVLGVDVENLDYMQVALEEIFNNINDHSSVKTACISAQHYKKSGELSICVSDFGIGITKTLENIYPDLSEDERLREAIRPGVSSRTSPRNRGFGLGNIIRAVTNDELGTIHLHSNHGIIIANKDDIQHKFSSTFYPGTFFEFKIDVKKAREIQNPEEEFSW